MADDADRASDYAERELERIIKRSQSQARSLYRLACVDCDEPLIPERRMYGLCVPCKTKREMRDKQWGLGA